MCWKAAWQLLDEKEQAGHLKRKAQLVTSDTATESSAGKAEVVLEEEVHSRHTTEPTHLFYQTKGARLFLTWRPSTTAAPTRGQSTCVVSPGFLGIPSPGILAAASRAHPSELSRQFIILNK